MCRKGQIAFQLELKDLFLLILNQASAMTSAVYSHSTETLLKSIEVHKITLIRIKDLTYKFLLAKIESV